MKIRGTPAHIAEKYVALARDAQSSGDPVLAENYLQHAEHYNRIIMAYREQLAPNGEGMNGNGQQRVRGPMDIGDGSDEFGDDDGGDAQDDGFPPPLAQQHQPQQMQPPVRQEGRQEQGGRHDGQPRPDRPFRRDQGRHRDRFHDRGDRDRQAPAEGRPQASERQQDQGSDNGADPRRRDRFQQPHEQPEFLRRPVRRARPEAEESEKDETRD